MDSTPMQNTNQKRDQLVGRLFESNLATYDLATIYIGEQLGLYAALAESDSSSAAQLAARPRRTSDMCASGWSSRRLQAS